MVRCWPEGKGARNFYPAWCALSCHVLWLRERGLWGRIYSLLASFRRERPPVVAAGEQHQWLPRRKSEAWRAWSNFLLISFPCLHSGGVKLSETQLKVGEMLPSP